MKKLKTTAVKASTSLGSLKKTVSPSKSQDTFSGLSLEDSLEFMEDLDELDEQTIEKMMY